MLVVSSHADTFKAERHPACLAQHSTAQPSLGAESHQLLCCIACKQASRCDARPHLFMLNQHLISAHLMKCTCALLPWYTACVSMCLLRSPGLGCRAVSSQRLVPGDVVVLLRGKATCDMCLLQGGCLAEESVLSGEVMPRSGSASQCWAMMLYSSAKARHGLSEASPTRLPAADFLFSFLLC